MKKHILTILSFLITWSVAAQQGAYIPPNSNIWIFNGRTVAFYGNMVNEGTIGSNPNSVLNFFGKSWKNTATARLLDESVDGYSGKGGLFKFSGNNPLNLNLGAQTIYCGFNVSSKVGPSFPNFDVDNKLGVVLDDLSDLKIRNNLNFTTGFIFLNGWNLVVGHKQPGTITGYNDKAFVVTGGSIAGGAVYREGVNKAAGRVVFPMGTNINNYSPAAVEYAAIEADDFHARVYDSVYQYAINGIINKLEYANKTWNIGHAKKTNDDVTVILQHMDKDEGKSYSEFRSLSFITRFMNNAWDFLSALETNPVAGTLTTGPTLTNSTMHQRTFKGGLNINEFFTKTSFIAGPYSPAIFMYFNAYRFSAYLAKLEWATTREVNNDHFEIERRFEHDTVFKVIANVPSATVNGNSEIKRDYFYDDPNDYDGWTYYRIKAVSKNNRIAYSETRAVPPLLKVEVWPNPNNGQFQVSVKGENTNLEMRIVNILGQVVRTYAISGTSTIRVNDIARGMYVLAFYERPSGRLVRTVKVIVIDR